MMATYRLETEDGSIYDVEVEDTPSPVLSSAKQFSAGAAEGLLDIAGLLSKVPGIGGPSQEESARYLKSLLPQSTEDTRYARTIGRQVGPSLAIGATGGVAALPAALASGVGAGLFEQYGKDTAGEIGGLVGGVLGGGIPSLFRKAPGVLRNLFKGPTQAEISGSAAEALRGATKLAAGDIEASIAAAPADELARNMTTAEVTQNAGAAQLEKTLANKFEQAQQYQQLQNARSATRDAQLNAMTPVGGINREGLGTDLMTAAAGRKEELEGAAKALWEQFPRDIPIEVTNEQVKLAQLLGGRQAGLPLSKQLQTLTEQFLGGKGNASVLTSGALQEIRSDLLDFTRAANPSGYELRVAGALSSLIDDAMHSSPQKAGGLSIGDLWDAARKLTRFGKETFQRGTAGGALVEPTARPANVLANALRGDSQSVKQLKAAIGEDPTLLQQVQRGVLDMIPRDAAGKLTPAKMKSFLNANEGGIKELFGEEHYRQMQRILEDLRSESAVADLAWGSSRGGSVTSQRETVGAAVHNALMNPMLWRISPALAVISRAGEAVGANRATWVQGQIEKTLFEALLDPRKAAELAAKPSKARVLSTLDKMLNLVEDSVARGALGGAIAGAGQASAADVTSEQSKRKGENSPRQGEYLLGKLSQEKLAPNSINPQATADLAQQETPQEVPALNKSSAQITSKQGEVVLNEERLLPIIDKVAKEYGVDPALIRAVIEQESGGEINPKDAGAGAVGLMQLLPGTAADMAKRVGLKNFDLKDPETNIRLGTRYLLDLLAQFKDPALALTAYHSGPARVQRLLELTKGSALSDIEDLLGPIGKKYAQSVLSRVV